MMESDRKLQHHADDVAFSRGTENMNEIKCPTCGDKVKYDPKSGMNHCDACGNYYFIN